jgi:AraC-like DNA-binding protein
MDFTVAMPLARGLVDFAVGRGANRIALLDAAGVAEDSLQATEGRLALDDYRALFVAAEGALGDPLLSFRYGLEVDLRDLSLLSILGQIGGKAEPALAYFNKYSALLVDAPGAGGERLAIERYDGAYWLVDRLMVEDFPQLAESGFSRMIGAAQRADLPSPFRRIRFTHSRRCSGEALEALLGIQVNFEQPWNAGQIDAGLLEASWAAQPSFIGEMAISHADAELERLHRRKGLAGRVRSLAEEALDDGEVPAVPAICARLGVSRQTLFRALRRENTSARKLICEARLNRARIALSNGHSIPRVAHMVGYSDRAAFSRAYKSWSGENPGSTRRASCHSAVAPRGTLC